MEYPKGRIVEGKIAHVTEEYMIVMFPNKETGFLHKSKMSPQPEGDLKDSYKKYQSILVSINGTNDKGYSLGCIDIERRYEKQKLHDAKELEIAERKRMKVLVERYASLLERGAIYEAEVISLSNHMAKISIEGVEGYIKKDELLWSENDSVKESLFVGEIIRVVFLEYTDGKLYFGMKYLKEKPYDESLYDLQLPELLKYAGLTSKYFIGQAKRYPYGVFIENLYSDDEDQKGKLLVDPKYGHNVRAVVPGNIEAQDGCFYRIRPKLLEKELRLQRNQLFQFYATEITEESCNPYKKDVDMAFQRNTTNPTSNQRDAKLLEEIGKNMYSSKERMFFELIQNADDAASENGVMVNVRSNGDFLIISHNGNSFDRDDFISITTAANGTKKANENKTGYKGIGFKSVFTDSEQVFISTGGYHFKFDKHEPIFGDFAAFYLKNNPMIINEETKKLFLDLYPDSINHFDGIHSIPWQLEPIWVNEFPEELGGDFTASNVAIALKLGEHKIEGDNGYRQAIEDIICNPKFMLFLRNTKRIYFNGRTVFKTVENGIITLKNSFDDNRVEYFKRDDFEIRVNNEVFEQNGIDVRIQIDERDKETGKIKEAKFVDLHNQELENIPKKIAINNSTIISFAIPITEDGLIKPNSKCTDISMFAFLPTLVKDFKFPFYINANFILDPPRQRILGDNPWNFYLMQEIARCLVHWCATLNEKQEPNALNVLLSEYFEEDSADTKQLSRHFNTAYRDALESEAFILNHKGVLSKQDEIIIDRTGLSKIIGPELFCKCLKTEKYLPSETVDAKILKEGIFEDIEVIEFFKVIDAITGNSDFLSWFVSANDEQQLALYGWIKSSKRNSLRELVSNLPLFWFGNEKKSVNDVNSESCVITTKHITSITAILQKLGFSCSDNILDENHPLYEFIEKPDEERLFQSIKECDFSVLDTSERKALFQALKDFDGVRKSKLKEIALFKNKNGEFKPLEEMVAFKAESSESLNPFMISEEDFTDGLVPYMIADENVLQEIVQNNYDYFSNCSVGDLYSQYKEQWTSDFTITLIDRHGATADILNVLEKVDEDDLLRAKRYFIGKFDRIEFDKSSAKDSIAFRVVRLALSCGYSIVDLKNIIYIDHKEFAQFTVDDDASIAGYSFSLSELFPGKYDNASFNHLKDLFSDVPNSRALFTLEKQDCDEIFDLISRNQNTYNKPIHIVYMLCYGIVVSNRIRKPFSDIEMSDSEFVSGMSYCFDNKMDVLSRYVKYIPSQKIIGQYINSDAYTLQSERLSSKIRSWADNKEKEEYLLTLGVKDDTSDEIMRRKAFVNNELFSVPYSDSENTVFLKWCCTLQTPFKKNNQVSVLKEVLGRLQIVERYAIDDYRNATEWDNEQYVEHVKSKFYICCMNGKMPVRGSYNQTHLYTRYSGDYVYLQNILYFNRSEEKNIKNILSAVCANDKIPFTRDDLDKIFMVSVDSLNEKVAEIAEKDSRISSLQKVLQEKDDLLMRYRAMYGDLDDKTASAGTAGSLALHSSVNVSGGYNHSMSESEMKAAQTEAQDALRQKADNCGWGWTFPDGFGKDCFSTFTVLDRNNEKIPIVLKSYKDRSKPFHINPNEWDFYVRENAEIYVYTYVDAVSCDFVKIKKKDLIKGQCVSLQFNVDNLEMEDRIDALSQSLHYFTEMHFDFNSFVVPEDALKIEQIYNRTQGQKQPETSDKDMC